MNEGARPEGEASPTVHDDADGPFEEWERYPSHQAQESIDYQKLAWYAAPFGSTGIALLVLAAFVNVLRRVARAFIRLLMR